MYFTVYGERSELTSTWSQLKYIYYPHTRVPNNLSKEICKISDWRKDINKNSLPINIKTIVLQQQYQLRYHKRGEVQGPIYRVAIHRALLRDHSWWRAWTRYQVCWSAQVENHMDASLRARQPTLFAPHLYKRVEEHQTLSSHSPTCIILR